MRETILKKSFLGPREHVIDRVVAGFEPTIESPSPSPSPQYNNGTPC